MPPTPASTTPEVKVLITGYGPFRSVVNNPSWLAVKPLHNLRLDLARPLSSASAQAAPANVEAGTPAQALIQCIQLPVHYGQILDTIPRLHSATHAYSPDATLWFDPRCDTASGLAGVPDKSYPQGYSIQPPSPEDGWDVILHVGVGRQGGVECETLAHKLGYNLPDAAECLAPLVDTEQRGIEATNGAQRQGADGKAIAESLAVKDGKERGFGKGYEEFPEVQKTEVDVPGLMEWLKQQGIKDVQTSTNAGRYLCEFILYASLCEAQRRAGAAAINPPHKQGRKTDVMFIHVPPVGARLDTPTCSRLIQSIAWYCAQRRLA
ncbi:hypothetical protein ACQY0O_007964 [Thecaphora frezii]